MATVDIILIVLILVSALFGIIRGLIASALSLAGWVLSFYLTLITFPVVEPYLESKISNPLIIKVLGYSILLVVYLIVFGIINLALNLATKNIRGNVFNRSFGLVFGFARGIVLIMAGVFFYHINFTALHGMSAMNTEIADQMPEFYKKGKVAYKLSQYTEKTKRLLPERSEERIVQFYNKLTNSSSEERFVEYAIIKIERNLSTKVKSKIRDKLNAQDSNLSKEELDLMNLKLAYAKYSELSEDMVKFSLSEDEAERIDSIVLGISSSSVIYEEERE